MNNRYVLTKSEDVEITKTANGQEISEGNCSVINSPQKNHKTLLN